MKLSVVIPMYNESERVKKTALRLTECLKNEVGEDYEIIFVCDGATDDTAEKARALCDEHIRLEEYMPNRGKGYAVRTGMTAARGDIRIFTDCDLAYGTEAVVQMYREMLERPEKAVCAASRAIHPEGYEDYSFFRRLLSRGYYIFIRMLTGLKVSDSQSGLKGFYAECAEQVFSLCSVDRFAFDLEVLMIANKLGFLIGEMPAKVIENGKSSIRLSDPFRMVRDVTRIKRRVRKIKADK